MKASWIPWILLAVISIIFFLYVRNHWAGPGGDNSDDTIAYWKNEAKQTIASLKKREIDFATEKFKTLDSFAKVFATKPKEIKEIVTVVTHVHDTIPSAGEIVTIKDSSGILKTATQVFSSNYYFAQATLDFTDQDKSFLNLNVYDTLTLAWKTVKEGGLFNRKTFLQLDVKNANPMNQITGLHAYRQSVPKAPQFGIGLFFGYGYSFKNSSLTPTPIIGAGVSWNPIRF